MPELKKCRVLVTANSFGKFNPSLKTELESLVGDVLYNPFGKPLNAQQVAHLLPGVDGYIAGLDQIDRAALKAADHLKVIARYGVGYDRIDLVAAKDKGIIVTNTPGANAASVAELTLGLVLMLARQIPAAMTALKQGVYARLAGISLQDKVIGILGLGAVGKEFAKRLHNFGCDIIAHDPDPDLAFAEQHQIKLVDKASLIANSDFISIHLPLLPETRGMVNSAFIQSMKKGAFLINTARGEVVDESALLQGILSGHIQGAALDVFEKEPLEIENPLFSLPQVICTPHIGAQTDGATNLMGRMALDECLRVLRGEKPKFPVD